MYDLVDKKIGNLKVIGYSNKNVCICKCDCEKLLLVTEDNLLNNIVTSCGHKNSIESQKIRLKRIYNNMKARCYNKNSISYKYYGKKGVIICDEWLDKKKGFKTFYNWALNNGYKSNLTIDRINSKGIYEPQNCRWADINVQNNNRTICHYITYKGKTLTLSQWAKKCMLSPGVLLYKINKIGEKETLDGFLKEKL